MEVVIPVISATLAAVILMMQQALMLNVGLYRVKTSVGLGTGNDKNLERLIRRHGNLVENAAIFIVLIALSEMVGAPSNVIIGFSIAFVIARICHILGFASLAGSHPFDVDVKGGKIHLGLRIVGSTGTLLSSFAASIYLLYFIAVQVNAAG